MNDEADILLIDTHSEGDCGYDDADFVLHPPQLNVFSRDISHSGMVVVALKSIFCQLGTQIFTFLSTQAIDDTTFVRELLLN